MNFEEGVEEIKKIQKNLLDYIDYSENIEEKYNNLISIFDDIQIHTNQFKIKLLFYLILKISNNHHRETDFFGKIEKILKLFKNEMQKYFSNIELFNIFQSNKRLLLFLVEENIISMNEPIVKKIIQNRKFIDAKYPHYFQPEIQPFMNAKWFPKNDKNEEEEEEDEDEDEYFSNNNKNEWVEELKKKIPDNFYKNRQIGENDDEICKYIQKDLIKEFIACVNKNSYSVNAKINPSIYETNNLLLKNNNVTLIEYAVFFGSIQIFKYLRKNGAKLNSSLWIYAVHGQNEEVIHILEENEILPSINGKVTFEEIFKESIKCHHIDITNYIQNNYLQNDIEYSDNAFVDCIKYYNFMFIQFNINNDTLFYYLCKYDCYSLVLYLLKNTDLNINKKIIYIMIFYSILTLKY